ncbi:hypothetical protein TCAL_09175 [Tigriopus californicus]|uniref:glucan 1,3-beta-glucosidase n=1 Tax=Tigriopus californicus TaxID=6832 RepID=A0A553P605_TIGCA|nr:uncharacterized protein LOC131877546 [Tigriopus californicus]TRY73119.1 hypothetical protein TCAL_09175 [Tigriopus californicus]
MKKNLVQYQVGSLIPVLCLFIFISLRAVFSVFMNTLFLTRLGKAVFSVSSIAIFVLTYSFCLTRLPHVIPVRNPQCNDNIVRGVNLGGWLLLEPWITPHIFEEANAKANQTVVDEWTLHSFLPPDYVHEILERHWSTFIQRTDLELLYSVGISHLRIPVGYWMFDVVPGEPFPLTNGEVVLKSKFFLRRLVEWCKEIGLKIVLDLHGAPGSQNGFDNSGKMGDIGWITPELNLTNVNRTLRVHELMIDMVFGWIRDDILSDGTLYGIAILNEPLAGWVGYEYVWKVLVDYFHPQAYEIIRQRLGNDVKVIIQQGFRNPSDFVNLMSEKKGYQGVVLDLHNYHFWNKKLNNEALQVPKVFETNIEEACEFASYVKIQTLPTIVGEWSLASTDCQKYLYGYSKPYNPKLASNETCKMYDGNLRNYSDSHRQFLQDFLIAQMEVQEAASGYFFWTVKTEDHYAPEWDFLALIKNGIVPHTLCTKKSICSSRTPQKQ